MDDKENFTKAGMNLCVLCMAVCVFECPQENNFDPIRYSEKMNLYV